MSGRDAAPLRRSNWDQEKRRYLAAYLYPDSYTIIARVEEAEPEANCTWTVNEAVQAVAPCSQPLELAIPAGARDGRWSGLASVKATEDSGNVAQSQVVIEDRLIVAMGDSYLSGEGNPDVPADMRRLEPSERFQKAHWPSTLDPKRDPVSIAQWWDEPCHRSLLSWPVLAGLKQAAMRKQEAVTLVHLGCSAATAKEGLTAPQEDLPGCPKKMDDPRTCPAGRKETLSQLDQLKALLDHKQTARAVDRIQMSAGGIDIGFRGLVAYHVLPAEGYLLGPVVPALLPLVSSEEIICPYRSEATIRARFCWRHPTVEARLEKLPGRLTEVAAAFTQLGVAPGKVMHASYPDVLSAGGGRFCHHALDDRKLAKLRGEPLRRETEYRNEHPQRVAPSGYEAFHTLVPTMARGVNKWQFELDHPSGEPCDPDRPAPRDSEVCKSNWARVSLNRQIGQSAKRHGWKAVTAHEAAIAGHGWCMADDRRPLALPVSRLEGEKWVWSNGDGLASFDPYDGKSERWFRTANDSLLTQYGGKERIIQGSVHPTFRAHIAYADAVVAAGD